MGKEEVDRTAGHAGTTDLWIHIDEAEAASDHLVLEGQDTPTRPGCMAI
jgi:hypothetical protein